MKINCNSDHHLPLKKTVGFHNIIILSSMKVTITVHKFPQLKVCTNCLIRMKKKKQNKKNKHKKQNKKDKIWIKYNVRVYVIICLKESMLTKPMSQANDLFVIIITFLKSVLDFKHSYATIVIIQCKRLEVLMILQFFLLKEMIAECIFAIFVKIKPYISYIMLN